MFKLSGAEQSEKTKSLVNSKLLGQSRCLYVYATSLHLIKKKQKEIIVHTVYAFAPSMKTAVATETMICDLYVIFFNLYRGILVRKTTNKHQKVYKKG